MLNNANLEGCVDVCPPVRNRYFYGKLLDVFHFELEQSYFNSKRWLLNRLVSGYGVVCGLNVQFTADYQSIIVTPGLAIDKCGHEIMVCEPSAPYPLPTPPPDQPAPGKNGGSTPPAAGANPNPEVPSSATGTGPRPNGPPPGMEGWDCGKFVHVVLCYQECPSDPVPAMGGDCDTQSLCSPGAIRERYRIEILDGKLPQGRTNSRIADIIVGGNLNYVALANYVTSQSCQSPCPQCCIPLANIRIAEANKTYDPTKAIDISVRPICYTNDLLYEMILAMQPGQSQAPAKP